MSQIIKAYMGIFVMLAITFAACGILSAYMTVADAQDVHQSIINELENSDFYAEVMREGFLLCKKRGYELEITLYGSDYTAVVCRSAEDIPEHAGEILYAKVDLDYPLSVAFYGFNMSRKLCGYAR